MEVEDNEGLRDMSLQLEQLLSSDPVLHTKGSAGGGGTTDDYLEQLAPILKDALLSKTTDELLSKCDGFKKDRDKEIDEMCSGDHNEYMASVQQLGQVTQESENIKGKILNVNKRLRSTGLELAEKKSKLIEHRQVRHNVDSAIAAVTACLQVLDLTNNVHELLQDKRKFAALKSLEDLQNVHLKEVSNFGFAQMINQSVPALTKMVRTETLTDIRKWLDDIQHMNVQVGEEAFAAIEKQRNEWKQITLAYPELKKYKFNSPVEKCYRETGVDHLSKSQVDEMDFSHLYECVLVHSSMGMSAEFQHHFDTDRKIQRDYLIPDKLNFKNDQGEDDLTHFESVLKEVAGFCIIDRSISRNNETLRPAKDVEEIWDSLATKINTILATQIKHVSLVETLKRVKELIGTFVHTMQNAGFNISSIQGILLTLFKTYSDYMKSVFQKAFHQTVTEDDYMPLNVNGQELYDKILRTCWYTPSDDEKRQRFPRAFPFSKTYPLTCAELISFIEAHNTFLDDLQYDLAKVEDIVKGAVDDLLCNTVCKTLEERLKSNNREQVVQTLINVEHFREAAAGVEKKLQDQRYSGRKQRVSLQAVDMFKNARTVADQQVFGIIHKQIDNFIELEEYDWESTVTTDEVSPFISDMVDYLGTLISSTFGNLPASIKSTLYLETFDYLSRQMIKLLLNSSDKLSYEAVGNFERDVKYLEEYADNTAKATHDPSLTTAMVELRQCVNLIQARDFHKEYNSTMTRLRRYDRVTREIAQELFRRISYSHRLRFQEDEPAPREPAPGGGSGGGGGGSSSNSYNHSTYSSSSSTTTSPKPNSKFLGYYNRAKDKMVDKYNNSQQHSLN